MYKDLYLLKINGMSNDAFKLRRVNVMRYITPLREGGSLPALADADDDFKYVINFQLFSEMHQLFFQDQIEKTWSLKYSKIYF